MKKSNVKNKESSVSGTEGERLDKVYKFALKIFWIVTALLLVSLPVNFIWHVEISMEFIDGIMLTNGFKNYNPIQIYHLKMYSMMFVNLLSGVYIVYSFKWW